MATQQGISEAELRALPLSFPMWPAAGRLFGISRTTAYELVWQDRFPCRVLRVGNRYRLCRADVLRALGLSETPAVELLTVPRGAV